MQRTKPRTGPLHRERHIGDNGKAAQSQWDVVVTREQRAQHREDAAPQNPLDVLSRAFSEHAPSVSAPE